MKSDMSYNEVAIFISCSLIIAFFTIVGVITVFSEVDYKVLIRECEKELPRYQNCKLIAVPEEVND